MAEIDSLEISIQSNIDEVNKNLDLLINKMGMVTKGISAIGSNKGLEEFAKEAKTISQTMGNMTAKVSQSMKPIETQAKKVAKDLSQITEQYKDLGKGFTFSGSETAIQRQINKYTNALENAKLKKQELELAGKTEGQGYEDAVKNVLKYTNVIDSLKKQLAEINTIQLNDSPLTVFAENFKTESEKTKKTIEDFKNQLDNLREIIKSGGFEAEESGGHIAPVAALSNLLKQVQEEFPQEYKLISQIAEELNKAENLSTKLRGNLTETQKFGYDSGAIEKVFGIIVENTQKAQQQINETATSIQKLNSEFASSSGIENFKKRINEIINSAEELRQSGQELGFGQSIQNASALMADGIMRGYETIKEKSSLFRNEIEETILKYQELNASGYELKFGEVIENSFALMADGVMRGTDKIKESVSSLKGYLENIPQITSLQNVEKGAEISNEKIVELNGKLQELQNRLKTLKAEGLGLGFKDYDETIAEIAKINGQLNQYEKNLTKTQTPMSNLSAAGKQLKTAFSGIYSMLKKLNSGINSVLSKIGKLVKSMFSLGNAAKESGKGFNLNLKTILKYGFGIRSVYALVNKLRNAVKEGMSNLIQYSDETNASVSMLKSSLNQFKNSAAAAFAPILNAIAPVLNQLIQLFITATNAVNQFFAALTGQSSWIKAKYVYDDVAESIGGAAKVAKGALQPFDALNNLTTPSSGGAGGGALAEDMFETLPLEDKFKDLSEQFKRMWDNADFYNLGKKIGDDLKRGLDSIPWAEIKAMARKLGKSLATLINGFVEVKGLGYSLGETLAESINTAFNFLNSFVHNLHWASIGQFIADSINGFIQNIDWDLIKDTLVTGAKGLADTINNFVKYLDWDTVASTISNAVNTLSATVITFFENTDWSELGHKVGYTLEKAIEEIDFEDVGRAIADVVQAALDFFSGLIDELDWTEIKQAIKDLFNGFFDNVEIPDNLKGIISALVGLKLAILGLTALTGFAKFTITMVQFGKALGTIGKVVSGSALGTAWTSLGGLGGILTTDLATIMGAGTAAEIGLTIGTGIIGGIAAAIGGFELGKVIGKALNPEDADWYDNFKWLGEGGFFDQLLPDTSSFDSFLQDMGHLFQGAVDMTTDFENNPIVANLSSALIGPWGEAALNVPNKIEELKGAFDNAKEFLIDLSEKTVETVESMKEKAIETWEVVAPKLSETWEKLKSDASTKFGDIKTSVSDMWSELKENTIKTWDAIKTAIKLPINAIIGFINKMISGVISGINSMTSALSAINFKVPDGFPMIGGKEFKISIPKVNAPQIPYLANGAVFNGGNPYLAVVNDQPRGQTNIEAPLKTIQEALRAEMYAFDNNSGFNNGIDYGNSNSEALLNETRMQNQLLQQQNELLRAILQKPTISNGEIFDVVQSEAAGYKRRNGGKLAFT